CSVAIIVAAIINADVNPLPAIPAPAPIPVRRVVVIGVAPVPAAAHECKAVTEMVEMVEMVEMIEAGKAAVKGGIKPEAAIKAARRHAPADKALVETEATIEAEAAIETAHTHAPAAE